MIEALHDALHDALLDAICRSAQGGIGWFWRREGNFDAKQPEVLPHRNVTSERGFQDFSRIGAAPHTRETGQTW